MCPGKYFTGVYFCIDTTCCVKIIPQKCRRNLLEGCSKDDRRLAEGRKLWINDLSVLKIHSCELSESIVLVCGAKIGKIWEMGKKKGENIKEKNRPSPQPSPIMGRGKYIQRADKRPSKSPCLGGLLYTIEGLIGGMAAARESE